MTLFDRLTIQKMVVDYPKVIFLLKALFLSFLIAVSAQISVPCWPVPLTLQPVAILVIAIACRPSLAVATAVAYVLEGACGLPVFQGLAGGLNHMLGTRGGYIASYVPVVALVSYLKGDQRSFAHLFKICLSAQVPLYAMGVLWLSSFVGMKEALNLGLFPFLLKIPVDIAFAIVSCNLIQSSKHRFWP